MVIKFYLPGVKRGGFLFAWNSDFVDAANLSLKEYSF
jgi:hypothetical protein